MLHFNGNSDAQFFMIVLKVYTKKGTLAIASNCAGSAFKFYLKLSKKSWKLNSKGNLKKEIETIKKQ